MIHGKNIAGHWIVRSRALLYYGISLYLTLILFDGGDIICCCVKMCINPAKSRTEGRGPCVDYHRSCEQRRPRQLGSLAWRSSIAVLCTL